MAFRAANRDTPWSSEGGRSKGGAQEAHSKPHLNLKSSELNGAINGNLRCCQRHRQQASRPATRCEQTHEPSGTTSALLFGNRARGLLVGNHEHQNFGALVRTWISRCRVDRRRSLVKCVTGFQNDTWLPIDRIRRERGTQFACSIRKHSAAALSLIISFGSLENQPTMTARSFARLINMNDNRARISMPAGSPLTPRLPTEQRPALARQRAKCSPPQRTTTIGVDRGPNITH